MTSIFSTTYKFASLIAAVALCSTTAVALAATPGKVKDEPKMYTLESKTGSCKKGYTRADFDFVKVASDGSVTFKFKGSAPMSPVPKKYAGQYMGYKAGDAVCLPDSTE